MSKLEFLILLHDHEWNWKEGFKVHCQTCGAQFKDTTKIRRHRKGCSYANLIKCVTDGDYIMIQNPTPGKTLNDALVENWARSLEKTP